MLVANFVNERSQLLPVDEVIALDLMSKVYGEPADGSFGGLVGLFEGFALDVLVPNTLGLDSVVGRGAKLVDVVDSAGLSSGGGQSGRKIESISS